MALFALLATYDGFYLHLVKYRLYQYKDSKTEHLTHTVRAVLFLMILYFLFLSVNPVLFYFGLFLVFLDIITLGIDAYTEKDSRSFMGGLPRREYILHLFVNGFHFATISVFLVLKINTDEPGFSIINNFDGIPSYPAFIWLIKNLIPGAIIMSILHILLNFKKPIVFWNRMLDKISSKPNKLKKVGQ